MFSVTSERSDNFSDDSSPHLQHHMADSISEPVLHKYKCRTQSQSIPWPNSKPLSVQISSFTVYVIFKWHENEINIVVIQNIFTFYFLFRRSCLQISTRQMTLLTSFFQGLSQFLQTNPRIVPKIKQQLFPMLSNSLFTSSNHSRVRNLNYWMCQSVSHNKVINKKWTKLSIDQQKWYIHLYTSFISKLIFKNLCHIKNMKLQWEEQWMTRIWQQIFGCNFLQEMPFTDLVINSGKPLMKFWSVTNCAESQLSL